ncbi:MAG: coproporphyrinogen dehydrogenase HemZ [Clostridiales bacterium]|nr:coproporphyrinogen dehydrogenase HemZ [Clostridiales bacterium]
MILKIVNHSFSYEMKKICTLFFPNEKIEESGKSDIIVITEKSENKLIVDALVYDRRLKRENSAEQGSDVAIAMSVLLYDVLSKLLNFRPPWGILFGVRPAKLMHRIANEIGEEKAKDYFINTYKTTKEKANLASSVMHNENKIISLSKEDSFSLYISIPFCPTRCSYCSFVSHSIEKTKKLIEPYVDLLCKELESIGEIAKELSLNLETIYFGGGTPTTLSAVQLANIIKTIEKNFDLSNLREYTVEAGRPDTITVEKLNALKTGGITRISINPQTFNDNVLNAIGRRHTSEQTINAFEIARDCGFDNINMDLIAGLPLDTLESFKNSLDKAIMLSAESVTVHTLALKSASYIVTRDETFNVSEKVLALDMVNYSGEALKANGYYPYYMYRQSKSVGNLENVGWCKDGFDCLYNVFMMDETHSVFAAGAGAVTRLKNQNTGYIERIYNYKYPYEYIDNFNEILHRKKRILNFYYE